MLFSSSNSKCFMQLCIKILDSIQWIRAWQVIHVINTLFRNVLHIKTRRYNQNSSCLCIAALRPLAQFLSAQYSIKRNAENQFKYTIFNIIQHKFCSRPESLDPASTVSSDPSPFLCQPLFSSSVTHKTRNKTFGDPNHWTRGLSKGLLFI